MLGERGEFNYREESGWWREFGKLEECGGLVMGHRTDGTVGMFLSAVVVMVCRQQRGEEQQADYED